MIPGLARSDFAYDPWTADKSTCGGRMRHILFLIGLMCLGLSRYPAAVEITDAEALAEESPAE